MKKTRRKQTRRMTTWTDAEVKAHTLQFSVPERSKNLANLLNHNLTEAMTIKISHTTTSISKTNVPSFLTNYINSETVHFEAI